MASPASRSLLPPDPVIRTEFSSQGKRAQALSDCQKETLQKLAEGAPLREVLEHLLRTLERHCGQGMLASILLLDETGRRFQRGIGASLPEAFNKGVEGIEIASLIGTCCHAVANRCSVAAPDVATDPKWAEFARFLFPYGMRAAWSTPIFSAGGQVLGTFANYYREPRDASPHDMEFVEVVTRTAALAIERRAAEQKLEASEKRYRELLEALPVAVYTTDAEGRITLHNHAAAEFAGRCPEVGKDRWCVTHRLYQPDGSFLPHEECPMAVTLLTGEPLRGVEAIAEKPDGTRTWFIPHPTVIRGESGEVAGGINVLVDITERKRTEIALAHLAAIVQGSDDAIISKDLRGVITSWNYGAERMFGYTAPEAIGQPVTMLIPPGQIDEEPYILDRIRRGESIDHYETVRRRKDGTLLNISLTVSPIRDARGQIVGGSKIARDITERKLTADRQERAEATLRKSERFAAAGRMAATIAHEINNPLEAMVNLWYLLGQEAISPEGQAQLKMLGDELSRVSHITKQTLEFYREGKTAGPLNLMGLIEAAIGLFSRKAEMAGAKIETDCRTSPALFGFSGELRQVFANLIGNSLEASASRVKIRISPTHGGSDRTRAGVRVTFSDNGPGIAAEAAGKLFEPFFTTKEEKGTGLGLWVSKGIVQKHDGSIRMRSSTKPGRRGTTFSLFFPTLPSVAELSGVS